MRTAGALGIGVGFILAGALLAACQDGAKPAARPDCEGCTDRGGTCVRGVCLCEGLGDPCGDASACCAAGEACCRGACFDAAAGCTLCPDGDTACPGAGTFCVTGTEGKSCATTCADADRCGEGGCCGPGLGCKDDACAPANLTLRITPPAVVAFPARSIAADACEVSACGAIAGRREYLSVQVELVNTGASLALGDPAASPFFTDVCGTRTLQGLIEAKLTDAGGKVVAERRLDVACIADASASSAGAPAEARFTCAAQGVQEGWSAILDAGDPCGAIDVTGMPAGKYHLQLRVNPDGLLPESTTYDNEASADFVIQGGGLLQRPENRTCIAPQRPTQSLDLTDAFPALPSLDDPTALVAAPDGRLFAAERSGRVVALGADAITELVDLRQRVRSTGELGLRDLALHPGFASNHQLFVGYTVRAGGVTQSRVSRLTSHDGGATLDASTEQVLLEVEGSAEARGLGGIAFGPDGYLYVAIGDGSPPGDPDQNAQFTGSLLGKLLRIDPDGAGLYAIPPDNPYVAAGGRKEIWASGLRSPSHIAFDPSGFPWVADAGRARQEIDGVVSGADLGWPVHDGTVCVAPPCSSGEHLAPTAEYDGRAIVGGIVYRGTAIQSLAGAYLHADAISGKLRSYRSTASELLDTGISPVAFAADAQGEVLILGSEGRVHRLVPSKPVPGALPATLSASGCFDPSDASVALPALIPFAPRVATENAGATSRTSFAIPDGAVLGPGAGGNLAFPPGSVLAQDLDVGGRRVETRMLFRHADGAWSAASYRWNEEGTDAELLAGRATRDLGDGTTWVYPSPSECLGCHTAAAGRALGTEPAQLDGDLAYPGGRTGNQLQTLRSIGVVGAAPGNVVPLPLLDGPAPVAARARAFLHARCSSCHRPGGSPGGLDLRYSTPPDRLGACGRRPSVDELGIASSRILAAGAPDRSVLLARLGGDDPGLPSGAHASGEAGRALLAEWIAATDPVTCGACKVFDRDNHRYAACHEAQTRDDARATCTALRWDLPIVDSDSESELLAREVGARLGASFWLGVLDINVTAVVWVDLLNHVYTHWLPGEPFDANNGRCVSEGIATARWDYESCSLERAVLCEEPCTSRTDDDGDRSLGCGADCDDGNPAVHPGAAEICGDGVDQNCDGVDPSCP